VDPCISPFLSGASPQTFGVQALGHLVIWLHSRESGQPIEYVCFSSLVDTRGWAIHHVLGNCASAPKNPECRTAPFWLRGQRDLGHDKAQQALAVDWGGRCCVPKRRQVSSQTLNVFPVCVAERQQVCPLYDGILALQLLERFQRSIPSRLQRPCDRTVLRLHGIVLPLRTLGFIAGALETQLPVAVEIEAFTFHHGKRLQGRL
jgi:hypothetical protein